MGQLSDADFFARPSLGRGTNVNSVAIIVQHLAGNMASRWTDFLASDGEKPWRDREAEFAEPDPTSASRDDLVRQWAKGWDLLLDTVAQLNEDDLNATVTIRSKPHSVVAALLRQLDHYATHVGQIVTTARLFVPESEWRYFTLRPGETAAFNAAMTGQIDVAAEDNTPNIV